MSVRLRLVTNVLLAATAWGCIRATPASRSSSAAEDVSKPPTPSLAHARPDAANPEPTASEPRAQIDLAALAGELRFAPTEAGDGRLPADNTALVRKRGGTMMEHASSFGWSSAGTHFGWCQPSGGADCETCVLVEVASNASVEMERGSECDRHQSKKIATAWKEHRIGKQPVPTTWRYGRDVTITWHRQPAKGDRPARLHVGGRLGTETASNFVSVVEPELADGEPDYDIFPEAILPAPDGSRIAVLSHAFAGEFSDTLRLTVIDTDAFGFGAYHESGLALLKKDPARAAERFEIATAIEPKSWKAWHNLACARVLAGQPDAAEQPLARALAAGADAARTKARSDPDLAAARERPWFGPLMESK